MPAVPDFDDLDDGHTVDGHRLAPPSDAPVEQVILAPPMELTTYPFTGLPRVSTFVRSKKCTSDRCGPKLGATCDACRRENVKTFTG